MLKKTILFILVLGIIAIHNAGAQIITLDNDGGGVWKEYMSFKLATTPTEYALYKIYINGSVWEIYNATGFLKISCINTEFWNIVKENGEDIRVFNQTNQLYFYIEKWDYLNNVAIIWVNLSSGSTELNIAYGNPLALKSYYNNATKVFDDFTDFETQTLENWSITSSGTYAVDTLAAYHGNYGLDLNTAATTYIVEKTLKKILGRGIVIEFGIQNYENAGQASDTFYILDNADNGYALGFVFATTVESYIYRVDSGVKTQIGSVTGGGNLAYDTWYYARIIIKKDGSVEMSDGVGDGVVIDSNYNTFTKLKLIASRQTYFDYIKVYKLSDPVDFINPRIQHFQNLFGSKTIYVNITYLNNLSTLRYNPPSYYIPQNNIQLTVTSNMSITGVNTTYGANISIELINFVTLYKIIYNGTDITNNVTYQGTIVNTTTGYTYNVYNFTTYENGSLIIYGFIHNKAYDVIYKLDGESVDIYNTTIIVGEPIEIILPHEGNITISYTTYTNTTYLIVNTKNIGVGAKTVSITINDPENFTVGYRTGVINIKYGEIYVNVIDLQGNTLSKDIICGFYNKKYNIVTTDNTKLYACNNEIDVYFHGCLLKKFNVYLNHSNNGIHINITVNATQLKDYRNLTRIIASPNHFDIIDLSAKYPLSEMKLVNVSGTVIVDYITSAPTSVAVNGATSYTYDKPVLKITGYGNITITDLYKLTIKLKDRLNNTLNFYVTINNNTVESKGIVSKLLKPNIYTISVPISYDGFELWSFNNTTNNLCIIKINNSDKTLLAIYRIPTKITSKEYRYDTNMVLLDGYLVDYYNTPIQNKNVKIIVATKNNTRIYNTTTDASGHFRTYINIADNITYKITYEFSGDDIYVGTLTTKTFVVKSLPPPPTTKKELPYTTIIIVSIIFIASTVTVVYIIRHIKSKTQINIENSFRFFKRLK